MFGADASPSGFLSLGLAEKAKGCAGVSFSGGVVCALRGLMCSDRQPCVSAGAR